MKLALCVSVGSAIATPYLDHLGDDCFAMCDGVTGKCPTDFCGTGGWCCRWGLEWDTPGCYNVGCHGKHCCTKQGDGWEHIGEKHIGEKRGDHIGEQGWDHIGEKDPMESWEHIGERGR